MPPNKLKKRLLFIDLETTGLSPADGHVALSVGMALDDAWGLNQDPFILDITIAPTEQEWAAASPDALRINGFTWESATQGLRKELAKARIVAFLERHNITKDNTTWVGQNPKFDVAFLNALMGGALRWMDFPIDEPPTDVIQLARTLAEQDKSIQFPNFKGWGIARALGVEEEGALHTCVGGILACRRNFYALAERLNLKPE